MPRYAPRTIGYACELLHAPRTPDPAAVQRVHNRLFEDAQPCYSSFAVTPLGPILTNPSTRPGVVSQVAFLADRFQFREEMGGLTCEDFAARVRRIAEEVGEERDIEPLGAQVTIRSLVNPQHFRDARELLAGALQGGETSLSAFGAPAGLIGVRFAFPPGEGGAAAHSVRIESYAQDARSLFVETQGSYGRERLDEGAAAVETAVLDTYRFLLERALRFVAVHDRPRGEEDGNQDPPNG